MDEIKTQSPSCPAEQFDPIQDCFTTRNFNLVSERCNDDDKKKEKLTRLRMLSRRKKFSKND